MKNIILTGASRGLGLTIASTLLKNGYKIYAVNRTSTAELEALTHQYPEQLIIINFDLADCDKIKTEIFEKHVNLHIPIHAFINNAAIAYDDIITNLHYSLLEQMYKINVFSPMIITKNVLRNMLFNKIQGNLIHLSSISVHTGYKGLSMYASTKGALEAFSKNIAREWGEKGIRSNCIVAGFMETDMSASLTKEQKNRIYNRNSLKKPTETSSIADTISYLLSDGASSITGQNIFIDSGTI